MGCQLGAGRKYSRWHHSCLACQLTQWSHWGLAGLLSVHICIHISLQRSSWTSLYSSPGPQERESRSCRPPETPNQHSITSTALYWSKQITGQSRLKTGKTLHLLMEEQRMCGLLWGQLLRSQDSSLVTGLATSIFSPLSSVPPHDSQKDHMTYKTDCASSHCLKSFCDCPLHMG